MVPDTDNLYCLREVQLNLGARGTLNSDAGHATLHVLRCRQLMTIRLLLYLHQALFCICRWQGRHECLLLSPYRSSGQIDLQYACQAASYSRRLLLHIPDETNRFSTDHLPSSICICGE